MQQLEEHWPRRSDGLAQMLDFSTVRYPLKTPYRRPRLTGLYLFCSVKNHGIPEESTEGVISASKRFFSLPEGEKLKVLVVLCFDFSCSLAMVDPNLGRPFSLIFAKAQVSKATSPY